MLTNEYVTSKNPFLALSLVFYFLSIFILQSLDLLSMYYFPQTILKGFTCIIPFTPENNPVRQTQVLPPFNRWAN